GGAARRAAVLSPRPRGAGCQPAPRRPAPYLIRSLRFFRARARTVLRAGLALNSVFCLVIGWMPSRALVAGLRTVLSLSRPGMVKTPGPFLPSCPLIRAVSLSKTSRTCFLLSFVSVASCWTTADLVIALALPVWFSAMTPPAATHQGSEHTT